MVMCSQDSPPLLELTTPATADQATTQRRLFQRWITALVDEDTAADLTLAVNEALANAAEHARSADGAASTVRLTATMVDDQIRITITDDGIWLPPADNRTEQHGRGLRLIHALTTEAAVELTPHGTTVHLRHDLDPRRDDTSQR